MTFAVRVWGDPQTFIPRLRTIVSEIEPSALIQNAAALDEVPDPDRCAASGSRACLARPGRPGRHVVSLPGRRSSVGRRWPPLRGAARSAPRARFHGTAMNSPRRASGSLVPRGLLRCRDRPGLGGVFDGAEQRRCAFGWTGVLILRRQVRVVASRPRPRAPARPRHDLPRQLQRLGGLWLPRVPGSPGYAASVLWLAARASAPGSSAGMPVLTAPASAASAAGFLPRPRAASGGHDGGLQRELDGLERLAGHLGLAAGGPVRHAGMPACRSAVRSVVSACSGQPPGLRPHCLAAGVGADLARLRPRPASSVLQLPSPPVQRHPFLARRAQDACQLTAGLADFVLEGNHQVRSRPVADRLARSRRR